MLDPQGGVAERAGDDPGVRLKLLRPIRVVVVDLDPRFSVPPISPVSIEQEGCQAATATRCE